MKRFILSFIAVISVLLVLSILLTTLFIGSGYVISLLFEVSLLNAAALCIGATFVSSFIIFVFMYVNNHMEDYFFNENNTEYPVYTFPDEKPKNKKNRRHQ